MWLRLKLIADAGLVGMPNAGKSTLIKVLAGVHTVTKGEYLVDGTPTTIDSPRAALDLGIATVYQDLAMVPLMIPVLELMLSPEGRPVAL